MTPLQEFKEKAAKIMAETTEQNAVKQAKKMYRLKMRLFPKIDVSYWKMDNVCPLCKCFYIGDCQGCPLHDEKYVCCAEYSAFVAQHCEENTKKALAALQDLAERIFAL